MLTKTEKKMGKEEVEEQQQEKSQQLIALAEAKYKESNLKEALKYAKRARRLCPDVDSLASMITSFKILRAASKSLAAPDWYKILQVEPFCHFNTIKKQYKKLALVLHPDKNPHVGSEEAFKLVNEGFRFLSDKIRRKEYDMKLRIRIQDENMKGSEESVWGDTFWTACSTCRLLHQFERKYLGHNLVCPSCRKSFQAVEIGSDVDDSGNDENDTIKAWSERLKMRNSGGGESMRGSVSKLKTVGVELGRKRAASAEMGSRRANAAELKRKGENDSKNLEKEVDGGGGEWSGGRLRSGGLRKRTSSVGEIMERSQSKRVKSDDETLTLAELHSQVKRKAQKEKMRLKSKEGKKQENKEKEREREKERLEVSNGERASKVESHSTSKKRKDIESVNGEALKKRSLSALVKKKGTRDGDLDIMAVEDSDFYDFDKDRVERSFKQGQIWAIYDDDDGMPRHYALIDEVVSVNPFEVKISWLDLQSNADEVLRCWDRSRVSCGRFKVSWKTSVSSVNIFSHVVNCERAAREIYRVYPKKGSVWAVYKESTGSGEGRDLSVGDSRCYDIVVFLTNYSEMHGLSMAYLEKVDGFKTIFKRREIGSHAISWLEKDEVGLFSHQIPARKLSGDEAPGLSKDCWELDPASLPADLLTIGYKS